MLALADYADDGGNGIFPAMETLAQKLRCKRRQAQRVVRQLEDEGSVAPSDDDNPTGGKPGATRHYRIVVERLTSAMQDTGVIHDMGGVSCMTPKPPGNHQSTVK
jgi:hypothetical protein